MSDTSQLVIRALERILEPLIEAGEDTEGLRRLLAQLGWIPAVRHELDVPASIGQIASTFETVVRLADEGVENWSDLTALLDQIRSLVDELPATLDGIGAPGAGAGRILELGPELVELLLVRPLILDVPQVGFGLWLAGLIQIPEEVDGEPWRLEDGTIVRVPTLRPRLRFDRIGELLTDPPGYFAREYFSFAELRNEEEVSRASARLFPRLAALFQAFGLQATHGMSAADAAQFGDASGIVPNSLSVFLYTEDDLDIGVTLVLSGEHELGLGLVALPFGTLELEGRLDELIWQVRMSAGLGGIAVSQHGVEIAPLEETVEGEISGRLAVAEGSPPLIVGPANATRLEMAQFALQAGVSFRTDGADAVISAEVGQGRLVIAAGDGDSFLAAVLPPDGLVIDFDLGISWSSQSGIRLTGGVGLEVELPLELELGPITIRDVALRLALEGAGIAVETGAGLVISIGPATVTIEGFGARAGLDFTPGSMGPVDLSIAVRLPKGLGIELSGGPVEGGGAIVLDPDAGRYSGFLQLRIYELGVQAYGLLETKLPPEGPDYAFVAFLSTSFPGIQLGYGFTLNGLGGVLAIHRRLNLEALQAQLAAGSVGDLLAPDDPEGDPTAVIAGLGTYFPATAGRHVFGPTAQFRWIELIRFDVGILIELPGPTKIVLLGSARMTIAADDAELLRIRLDLLGVLDFERELISLDAALVDSQLLEVLELTGGAALRMCWGARPYALQSVGGFHPRFTPEPDLVPVPERVGMTAGSPEDILYLRLEGYFATTTNSLQFGALAEVRLNAVVITAEGSLAFDALIQFSPFYFVFEFSARFRIRLAGITLAGASMNGVLSGPGPLKFEGRVCIELLFFEICWRGSITLGGTAQLDIRQIAVLEELVGEINSVNLSLLPGARNDVLVRPGESGDELPIVDPQGELVWQQRRAPFGVILERFEGEPLDEAMSVEVQGDDEAMLDWFAAGSFLNLEASEALNRKAFERLPSGIRIGGIEDRSPDALTHEVEVEEYILPEPESILRLLAHFPQAWTDDGRQQGAGVLPMATVTEETWELINSAGGTEDHLTSEVAAQQRARWSGGIALPAGDRVMIEDF